VASRNMENNMTKSEMHTDVLITGDNSTKVRIEDLENSRPGDWMCPNCGDHNYSFRDFCRKCFHTKDGEKKQIEEGKKPGDWHCQNCAHLNYQWRMECQKCQRKKPWSAGTQTNGNKVNPNDWTCPNCGDRVFASRTNCRKCNTSKMMAMRVMQGMGPMGMMGGNMGGFSRQSMQSGRPGDWNCPNCGDMQYAFRTECRKCATAKPAQGMQGNMLPFGGGFCGGFGGQQSRAGDWNCPSCSDMQYAFRTECRKCGTAKPAGGNTTVPSGQQRRVGGRRDGDWDCPACSDMQYAIRTECRKCGTAKPTE